MPRPLDPRITREVIALREDGADLKTIVKKTGVSLAFVSTVLRQSQLKHLSCEDLQSKIITLRDRRTSISRIAQTLDIKPEFVSLVCGSPPERERLPKKFGPRTPRPVQHTSIVTSYREIRMSNVKRILKPDPSGLDVKGKRWDQLTNEQACRRIRACLRTGRVAELWRD